jgi:hypothetical protein
MIAAARAGYILSRFEGDYFSIAANRRVDVDAFFGGVGDPSKSV